MPSPKKYFIKDSEGNIVNTIIADISFVSQKYKFYEEVPPSEKEMRLAALKWRNEQLVSTDWINNAPDHPDYNAYLTYRQGLRDWPGTNAFPTVKPTLEAPNPVVEEEPWDYDSLPEDEKPLLDNAPE